MNKRVTWESRKLTQHGEHPFDVLSTKEHATCFLKGGVPHFVPEYRGSDQLNANKGSLLH